MKRFDLENRLIEYAVAAIQIANKLPGSYSTSHLTKQLIRSSTSMALNYAEAQAAESRADFVHKLKIYLKELKESQMCLKILNAIETSHGTSLSNIIEETGELIAIFIVSVKTAKSNSQNPQRSS